jgi:hypothetical protein
MLTGLAGTAYREPLANLFRLYVVNIKISALRSSARDRPYLAPLELKQVLVAVSNYDHTVCNAILHDLFSSRWFSCHTLGTVLLYQVGLP